jgi:CBS domain-containing protein
MKCADIMTTNLEWLAEHDTLLRAATIMAEANVGFLPICDDRKRVIGVVTDRDLTTRALAKGLPPATTSAAMVMTSPALTCPAVADVRLAEELMAKERRSRLVITDAEGRLAGVLSLADLVEHAPGRQALATARKVLWREALGPRAGAERGEPLLKDDPEAKANAPVGDTAADDDREARETAFTGGHWRLPDTKEFPGV